jgi:hypothetical protein
LAFGAVVSFALATTAVTARAQPSPTDVTLAGDLFRRGKELMAQERYAEACALFEQSQKHDPGTGTLLNMALCHEKVGRFATAWTELDEVIAQSRAANRQDRVQLAREHADRIAPLLPHVIVEVRPADGIVVRLDGSIIERPLWGKPLALDPGDHALEATAPAKAASSSRIHLEPRETQRVTVELKDLPKSIAAKPAPAPAADAPVVPRQTDRTLGYVLTGAGFVTLGVGVTFGVLTISKNDDSKACARSACGEDTAYRDARTYAWVADIAIPLGAIGVGVGAFLLLRPSNGSPPSQRATLSSARVRPRAGPHDCGLVFEGAW